MKRHPRGAIEACLLAALIAAGAGAASPAGDRLERFRALAASGLSVAHILQVDGLTDTHREIYALLDEEIVESLASGGVFASTAFLQDRLDAFGEAWGGAAIRIAQAGPVLVGSFQLLGDAAVGNSVRVYGRLRDEAALLAAFHRPGRPVVYPLPGSGAPHLLLVWDGPPSGRGSRALRLDVLRADGDSPAIVWTSADVFPDGLVARGHAVRGAEALVGDERGQVHGQHGDVEAAHEVAPEEEVKALLVQRFAQRLADRLLLRAPGGRRVAGKRQAQRNHQRRHPGEDEERRMPAEARDQELRERQQQELAERAGGRRDAHGEAAALGRHGAADDRQDDAEGRAAQRAAEEQRRVEMHEERSRDVGKADEAQDVADGAEGDDAPRAVAVGEAAGERAERTPHQVLQRDREREHLAAPAVFEAHRLQEQAEAGADAERDQHDDGAAGEHHRRRAPGNLCLHHASLQPKAKIRDGPRFRLGLH